MDAPDEFKLSFFVGFVAREDSELFLFKNDDGMDESVKTRRKTIFAPF